jgi:hypothetical protein
MKRGRLAQFKQVEDRLPASLGRRASCLPWGKLPTKFTLKGRPKTLESPQTPFRPEYIHQANSPRKNPPSRPDIRTILNFYPKKFLEPTGIFRKMPRSVPKLDIANRDATNKFCSARNEDLRSSIDNHDKRRSYPPASEQDLVVGHNQESFCIARLLINEAPPKPTF